MDYYLFFDDYEGNLHQVGYVNGTGKDEQDVVDELWRQIQFYIQKERPNRTVYYFRTWNSDGFTVVDFGSHSEFFRIRPELRMPT